MSSSPRDRARVGVLLVLCLFAGACAERAQTGVALQNVDADIVFASREHDPPAPPANTMPPAAPVPAGEGILPVTLAPLSLPTAVATRPPSPTTTRPVDPCPAASVGEVGADAPVAVDGMPAAGVYRWKRAGAQEVTGPPAVRLPIQGFEQRLVRDVAPIAGGDGFRFEVVQPELGSDVVVATRYRVRVGAASTRQLPAGAVSAGEPDRGLSIERIVRYNAATGAEVSSFVPTPPVLLFPLPVVAGEEFQSVGIDPTTFERLQVDGRVTTKRRIDACGDVIDGWTVETTQTFSSTEGPAVHSYTLVIATALGALPVFEAVTAESPAGRLDVEFTIGGLRPRAPEDGP